MAVPRWFAAGAALLGPACVPGLSVDPQVAITCDTLDDCPLSWRCSVEHLCLAPDALDPDGRPPQPLSPAAHEAVSTTSGEDLFFFWSAPLHASRYQIEIARDADFVDLIAAADDLVETHYLLDTALIAAEEKTVFWRVRADTSAADQWGSSSFEPFGAVLHVYCSPDHDPAPPELPPCGPPYVTQGEAGSEVQDAESGNLSTPFRSIRRALAAATVQGVTEVRVARREPRRVTAATAAYEEALSMPAGIRLLGGYLADGDPLTDDFTEAARDLDPMNRATVRANGTVLVITGVIDYLVPGATPTTVVEGLWLENGTPNSNTEVGAAILGCSGSLAFRDNTVRAGGETFRATGLLLEGALAPGPSILDNDIEAVGEQAIGVDLRDGYCFLGANRVAARGVVNGAEVTGLRVSAADFTSLHDLQVDVSGTWVSRGVVLEDVTQTSLARSTIVVRGTGDIGSSGEALGVLLMRATSNVLISGNAVYTVGARQTRAFVAEDVPWQSRFPDAMVANNVLWAAPLVSATFPDTGEAHAAALVDASGITLANNTAIIALDAGNTSSLESVFLLSGASYPILHNNLLAASGAAVATTGIDMVGGALPRSLQNNALVGIDNPLRLELVVDGSPNGLDGWQVCLPPFQEPLQATGLPLCEPAGAQLTVQDDTNLLVAAPLDAVVVGPAGALPDWAATVAANDWSLSAGADAAGISAGGRDTAVTGCGYLEHPEACGCSGDPLVDGGCSTDGITLDQGGALRSSPLSIGAYERD